jgi:hypothetical protein
MILSTGVTCRFADCFDAVGFVDCLDILGPAIERD